jgi:hypothetical protein
MSARVEHNCSASSPSQFRVRMRTGRLFKPRRMTMLLLRSSWSGDTANSNDSTEFTISRMAQFISWRASNGRPGKSGRHQLTSTRFPTR